MTDFTLGAMAGVLAEPKTPTHTPQNHPMHDTPEPAPGAIPSHGDQSGQTNPQSEEGGEKRRRRRRRGRGRGGPDARAEGGEPKPSHAGEAPRQNGRGRDRRDEEFQDAPGEQAEAKPRRKAQAVVESGSKDWEEIFAGQTFTDLGLRNSVVKGCEAAGFTNPTKIQAQLIPLVLSGKDVLGQSRTGTGKTAAFGLPLFHMAQRQLPFQSIILAPTRELAIQIAAELTELGKFTPIKVSAVYGGQQIQSQARNLEAGPEIIVATPGRLMDMKERGYLTFDNVKFIVLDEVDRMLDIGFRDDIRKILGQIRSAHQTVFVSATISPEIEGLARQYMKDPEKLVTTGTSLTVSLVDQYYLPCEPWDKRQLLLHVLNSEEPDLTVIFCRTKRTVDELTKFLKAKGIDAHAIHGDMYQGKRNSVMKMLRAGQLGVLVASDLAARGLDVDDISHVVNYDLPEDPEVYIHRIGRTARAGRRGVAWSLVAPDQGELLTAIEILANTHIPEKRYPDFVPGQLPSGVRAERAHAAKRLEHKRSQGSRFAPTVPPGGQFSHPAATTSTNPAAPSATPKAAPPPPAPDPHRFPGGVVPSKMPPKMMRGRVKTARSMKSQGSPPPAAPPADGPAA